MKGFNIDKSGSVLSVAVDLVSSYIDEEGKEVKVKQPENTVYTEDFGAILAAMTAPLAKRKTPIFAADGSYTFVAATDYEKAKVAYADMISKKSAEDEAAWIEAYLDQPKSAEGVLKVDKFQDGKSKAPFSLVVRNETAEPVSFIAIIREAPYEKIPKLAEGDYSLETTKDGVGYTHTFTGKLTGYASISITGGVPSPVGNGKTETSPELYLA